MKHYHAHDLHHALICDWGSCRLPAAQTQTKDKLNCLALIGVITLSTTFPLSRSMQKLCTAIAVGGNCTQAIASIGDRLRVDCTYTTWLQLHHVPTDFIKEDPIAAIS